MQNIETGTCTTSSTTLCRKRLLRENCSFARKYTVIEP